jgi:aspartyl-tRNA(Asn)/glutamyl-tRNA(Gln) amidotransferase subunit B
VPLVEIVSEPDITSAQMAKDYLLKMQQIIRYLGISDADIEKGSMRCEPTVNLKIEDNDQVFYTPLVEIKNVASLTGVQTAIDFEIHRQTEAFKQTGEVKSKTNKNTFGWDADKNQTFLQREKEGSSDYRYFPEPDIPHIEFTKEEIEEIRKTIPELPDGKITRYKKDFSLNDYDANLLTSDIDFSKAYELALGQNPDSTFAKFTANLFIGAIKTHLNESQENLNIDKINSIFFKNLFDAVSKSEISSTVAKQVIIESYQTGKDPVEIAKSKGLIQVSDSAEIEKLAIGVISQNSKAVEDYKKNPASIGFLIGKLMQASKGSANPQLAKEILEKLLK